MRVSQFLFNFFRKKKPEEKEDANDSNESYDPNLDDAELTKSNVFKAIRPDTYTDAYDQFISSWDKNLISSEENLLK